MYEIMGIENLGNCTFLKKNCILRNIHFILYLVNGSDRYKYLQPYC